jgi:hypothetical protein
MADLFLDIETIPVQDDNGKARIASMIKPPAAMKKADTIAAWEANDKPTAIAEAIAKTSFNAAYGQVCCIGMAIDDGDVTSISWPLNASDETVMIASFFSEIGAALGNRFPTIVGHNVIDFDIRFIWQRCMVLGIRVPAWLPRDPKPWGGDVFDTMTAWAGARNTISMDNLCLALGIPGKDEIDGSMVAQMFADGKHREIAAYCRSDIERTRAIYRKMQVAFGGIAA